MIPLYKISAALFFAALFLLSLFTSITYADIPAAAQLLDETANPYTSTGVQVTVSNAGNMYGLANDGEQAFIINSSGNIVTVPLAALAASTPGSATTTSGTVHAVAWSDGSPNWPNSSRLSIAYSHGCVFITSAEDNDTPEGTIELYCIDTSDYSVTEIEVPGDKPLPRGYYFANSNLVDFPDGRIGKVSRYENVGGGQYRSILRLYTIGGTGGDVVLTWSEDIIMGDNSNWAIDEHGLGTDGTYLYRIQWRDVNPNTKVWQLASNATSTVVYSGGFTRPFGNMHYLSHNHDENYYLVGHYSNNQFFITSSADPGPGPGNPLTPAYDTISYSENGFTVQIANYDGDFEWTIETTAGIVELSEDGLITVTGLEEGESATVTVSTERSGYPSGSSEVTGTLPDVTNPSISSVLSSGVTSSTATITWITSEDASSKVAYGLTTEYNFLTSETDTSPRVDSHTASLSSLLSCTTYHYAAISRDAGGNIATSTDAIFTTLGCEYDATPISATSTTITSSSGGSTDIQDDGKTFTVTAPSGATATSSSFVIQVRAVSSASVLASLGRPSTAPNEVGATVFDVKAIIDGTTILDSFDAEITIEYAYRDDEISTLNESSLWLYHYTGGQWEPLNNCTVNIGTNTISCTTPSFSVFGLFGNEKERSGGIGGGTHFGCKDTKASNYEFFSRHKQDLCKYEPLPVAASVCAPHMTSYIRYGAENDPVEVKKLEIFLNEKQGEGLVVDGIFSLEDVEAVKRFQEKYSSEVLGVWGLSKPTGYVYRTTLMKINSFYCNGSIVCPAFTEYNNLSENSVSAEVSKTKVLLTELGFYSGTINNTFDTTLSASLKSFQETFRDTMLKPWGLTRGTGYKYKTTNKFLNLLVGCKTPSVDLDGKGSFDY